MANYYEILEVNEKASIEVIDKAYRVLAKKYHPDIYQGDKKEAEIMMKKLNEAYSVLSDETKRSNYDAVLTRKKQLENLSQKQQEITQNQTINKSAISNNISNDSPINNPSKYNKDKFVVDTTYMDEKQKKKIEKKLQQRYIEAYDNYLRSRGYKLKYKWTPKRIFIAIGIVLAIILVCILLFYIPPINDYLMSLYNDNLIVRFIVIFVRSIVSTITTVIQNIFNAIF